MLRRNFENSCDQVTFRMPLTKKITITVTEVVLIQVSFLTVSSKSNNNNEHAEYHGIFIPFIGKIYSKQGSHISLLFGTWALVLFSHAGALPEIFQGRGGFLELGHLDKLFIKNTRKSAPQENILEFFLDAVKTTFRMKSSTQT